MFLLSCLYLLLQARFYVKITDSLKETWNSNFDTRLPQWLKNTNNMHISMTETDH